MMAPLAQLSFTTLEVVSLAASITSVALAVFAIWVTLRLYSMSNAVSTGTKEAVGDIKSEVAELKESFRRQYSETFQAYRDDHARVWELVRLAKPTPEGDEARKAELEAKYNSVITALQDQAAQAAAKVDAETAQMATFRAEVDSLIRRAVEQTREVEAAAARQRYALMSQVLKEILAHKVIPGEAISATLKKALGAACPDKAAISDALKTLVRTGVVEVKQEYSPWGSGPEVYSLVDEPSARAYLARLQGGV